jgi:hypothetical protein
VNAEARRRGAVNTTSVESTTHNDIHEVKRQKWHSCNITMQTAKQSTIPVPKSAAVKLPPKSVLTCKFFAPLRTIDMDTETIGEHNALPGQEALLKIK